MIKKKLVLRNAPRARTRHLEEALLFVMAIMLGPVIAHAQIISGMVGVQGYLMPVDYGRVYQSKVGYSFSLEVATDAKRTGFAFRFTGGNKSYSSQTTSNGADPVSRDFSTSYWRLLGLVRPTITASEHSTFYALFGGYLQNTVHTEVVRTYADGHLEALDPAIVDYTTGGGLRFGLGTRHTLSERWSFFFEGNIDFVLKVDHVEFTSHFGMGDHENLVDDRIAVGANVGIGYRLKQ